MRHPYEATTRMLAALPAHIECSTFPATSSVLPIRTERSWPTLSRKIPGEGEQTTKVASGDSLKKMVTHCGIFLVSTSTRETVPLITLLFPIHCGSLEAGDWGGRLHLWRCSSSERAIMASFIFENSSPFAP